MRDIAGRRLISGAARSVNSAISSLNLAKDTLESLSSITSDLTALAERSAVRGVSNTQRSKLNARFERKTDEFRRVVDDAQIGPEDEDDLLTKDGLTEVFDSLGLDSDRSEAVADLLSSFIAADRTNSLANERVSVRAVTVPGVEQPPSNSSDRVLELVSVDEHSAGVTSGFIATDHNIFHSEAKSGIAVLNRNANLPGDSDPRS